MKVKIFVHTGPRVVVCSVKREGETQASSTYHLAPYDAEVLADLLREAARKALQPGPGDMHGRVSATEPDA